MLLLKGSTPMPWPFRPEHSAPTSVTLGSSLVGAAKTPTTGNTWGLSWVPGHCTPLFVLLLEAVYQRRTLGLKTSVSVPVTSGNVPRVVPSLRSIAICGLLPAHPITAVLVSASISIPRLSHPGVGKVATMAAAPLFV